MKKVICLVFFTILVVGCAFREVPAPIENATGIPADMMGAAEPTLNPKVANSSESNEGSQTTLSTLSSSKVIVESSTTPPTSAAAPAVVSGEWVIPTDGTIIQKFSQTSKGIDFSGSYGQEVVATNSGKVLYSGNGLKGYGNLIIIKHPNGYLSAYAHNKVNVVHEGTVVKRGQKIAEMGKGDNGRPLLHFELRKNGKPLDPLSVIGSN